MGIVLLDNLVKFNEDLAKSLGLPEDQSLDLDEVLSKIRDLKARAEESESLLRLAHSSDMAKKVYSLIEDRVIKTTLDEVLKSLSDCLQAEEDFQNSEDFLSFIKMVISHISKLGTDRTVIDRDDRAAIELAILKEKLHRELALEAGSDFYKQLSDKTRALMSDSKIYGRLLDSGAITEVASDNLFLVKSSSPFSIDVK